MLTIATNLRIWHGSWTRFSLPNHRCYVPSSATVSHMNCLFCSAYEVQEWKQVAYKMCARITFVLSCASELYPFINCSCRIVCAIQCTNAHTLCNVIKADKSGAYGKRENYFPFDCLVYFHVFFFFIHPLTSQTDWTGTNFWPYGKVCYCLCVCDYM